MKQLKACTKVCISLLTAILMCNSNAFISASAETDSASTNNESEVVEFKVMSSIWGDHEKSLNSDKSNEILDLLMKNAGVKITYDWYPQDQYSNRVTTTLASGDIPEVINGASTALINEDAALPLDELLEKYGDNILNSYKDIPVEATKLKSVIDGKTYAIPFILKFPQAYSWSIRTDWLKNVGIEKKPETWDEWLEVWEAFKTKDPNGDGNKDNDIPLSVDIYSMMPIFGINTANKFGFYVDDNNTYTIAEESEHFDDFMTAMRDLYSKGYLDPEFAQRGVYVDVMKQAEAINSGVVGSTFTWAETTRTTTAALQEVQKDAKLEGVRPPVGPQGHSALPSRSQITPTSSLTIAAKGKEEAIIKYFNYVFSDEGKLISSYGIEGKHYEIKDGKPHILEPYVNSFKEARQAGINFTPVSHNFDPSAYEEIMMTGKSYEESPETTKLFYDALNIGNDYFFTSAPILNTETYIAESTELLSQLASARAECVAGNISLDEFKSRYQSIKDSGLGRIIEEQNEAWQAMTAKN